MPSRYAQPLYLEERMKNAGRGGVGRRRAFGIATLVTCALLVAPAAAQAVSLRLRTAPDRDMAKPFFDSRVAARHAGTRVAASTNERSARTQLRSRLGREAVVQVDPVTGTTRSIQRLDGTLTGPAAGDRGDVAMRWVRANRAALGLTGADVDGLKLADRAVASGTGVTHLRYRQAFDGIPAFDNDLRVNLDRGGRIINVTGTPISGLGVASTDPRLDAVAALRALQRNVGVARAIDVTSGPAGVRQVTRFAHGDFARLVIFGGADGPRLAWHLTYRASTVAYYDAVVDATTGDVLYRQNLTKFADATQQVFPNYPGAEEEPDPKGTANDPTTVQFETDWLPDAADILDGPFAHVYSDSHDNNAPDAGEEIDRGGDPSADFEDTFNEAPVPTAAPGEDWTNACDFDDDGDPGWPDPLGQKARCSWDPTDPTSWQVNREQNGVQAFYFVNRFHDHLLRPEIGFDDPENFEDADKVVVNTDDGAGDGPGGGPDGDHLNNANMSTPPEGEGSPLMQMYLFAYDPDPDRFGLLNFRNVNGGDDAGTVWHEYTHGLSNRLVTNDDGAGALSSPHAGAMGEAWSDWYALDLLHRDDLEFEDLDTPGEVDIGMYTDATFASTRYEPADCPVGTTTDDRCPGSLPYAGEGGFTFGDFGQIYAFLDAHNEPVAIPEVHSDGEIWLQTLWQLRTELIRAANDDQDAGSDAAEEIITEAMRLSPPEPSFLDMRNAILAADEAINGGANRNLIWGVFANRGMGFFASVLDSSDVTPTESFLPPPAPGAATGNTTGAVTSADTGLPIANATIGFGGLNTSLKNTAAPDHFVATTGANGRYTLTTPAGDYGDLLFSAPGYDQVATANVRVTAGETRTLNVALRRDWASARGGGAVIATSDDDGAPFGCGVDGLIDQNQGVGWSTYNPDSPNTPPGFDDPPTAVIQLPRAITIDRFGLDPAATCGDDATSTTREYEIYTSSDGVQFRLAKKGAFTMGNAGQINSVAPTANAANVRFVMLKLLSPQSIGGSGRDFIDFSELEVFGGPKNVLPSGALRASATTVNPGQTVQFVAAFTDPDSKITGYRWDFDSNGTIEQTTTTPTASFAYPRSGDFTARVSAIDFRGGSGAATQAIHVTSAPIAATPPKTGSKGRLRFRVSCELSCTTTAKLTITKKLAKQLGLKNKRTVGSLRRTLAAGTSTRLTIKLTKKAKRALKRHRRKSVKATVTVTVRYADGRRDAAKRKVTIKL
jgi:extracellular elastinolytic metalloproteinase